MTVPAPHPGEAKTRRAGTTTGSPSGAGGSESTTLSQNSVQDLYDQLKLADEMLSGAYANAVMIGHTATEFSFDFITTFFPRSAVSSRVYMSAGNVPRFLSSITHAFDQFQRKVAQQQQQHQQPPPNPPHPESAAHRTRRMMSENRGIVVNFSLRGEKNFDILMRGLVSWF